MEIKKSAIAIKNITKYSMKMFFRDKRAIFFSLFMPMLIMIIFGVMNFEETAKVKLDIVDNEKNISSAMFIDALEKIDTLVITKSSNVEDAKKAVEKGDEDMVLIIPDKFGANVTQLGSGKADTQKVEVLYSEGKQNGNAQIGMTIINGVLDKYTHMVTKTPNLFVLDAKTVKSSELKYIDYLIPGIVAMGIMMMSVMGVVGSIVEWRKREVLRRLLATPVKPRTIIFGQVTTRLILSVFQTSAIVLMGVLIFHVHMLGSWFLLYLLAILGGIIFLNIGFAISGLGNSQNTVMAMANLVLMPMMFLSGIFFPKEAFPEALGNITQYMPLTYLADAMRSVMNEGSSIVAIRGEILGLLVWALITFVLAVKFFRWE